VDLDLATADLAAADLVLVWVLVWQQAPSLQGPLALTGIMDRAMAILVMAIPVMAIPVMATTADITVLDTTGTGPRITPDLTPMADITAMAADITAGRIGGAHTGKSKKPGSDASELFVVSDGKSAVSLSPATNAKRLRKGANGSRECAPDDRLRDEASTLP
jgi:hypothetical protein